MSNNFGFGYVFDNPNGVHSFNSFISEFKYRTFKKKLIDNFKQECYGKMNKSTELDTYNFF